MKIGNVEVYGIIYKITNKVNGKVYIGQTTEENGFKGRYSGKGNGIERFFNYCESEDRRGKAFNRHIYNSIKKYGFNAFEVIEVYDVAFSEAELNIKEFLHIKKYNSTDNKFGYNKREGGKNNKCTKETRDKISRNHADISGRKNPKARTVICLTTKKIFFTVKEGAEYYSCCESSIRQCCRGFHKAYGKIQKVKSAGKLSDGTPLKWRYLIWKHNKKYRIKQ